MGWSGYGPLMTSSASLRRPITPIDLFDLRAVGEVVALSDDRVAYTITWPDLETDENRSCIHVREADGATRQLTDGHSDSGIAVSPGGTRLSFLRREIGGAPHPATVEIATGDVTVIEGFEDGVRGLIWAGDHHLIATAPRRPLDQVGVEQDELERRPRVIRRVDYRFNARGWTHDRRLHVFRINLDNAAITTLTTIDTDHNGISVSPDATTVLCTAGLEDDADLTGATVVLSIPVAGGDHKVLTAAGRWGQTGWTSDGRPLVLGDPAANEIRLLRPHVLDPAGDAAPEVIGPHDVNSSSLVGPGRAPTARSNEIYLPGIHGGAVTVDRYDLTDGSLTTVADGPVVISSFDVTSAGSIIAAVSSPTKPAELWEFTDGVPTTLLSLNGDLLASLDLVEPEVVSLRSTDGVEVEAFVFRPPPSAVRQPSADAPGPALHYIHGGPMFTYGYGFFDEFQIAASTGYTVIGGNPRGSDGYGEAWASSVKGRLGTIDWQDVTAMSDHLISLPEVDENRVGIGGGSYGGFMTAWAIGHTDRYRAALVERCVSNWESFEGTSDIGGFFGDMLVDASNDGEGENGVAGLKRQSPITYANNVTTPTLIVHSEEDWRCPIEQSEQLFAAYRRNGLNVTFVRFPGENHELTRNGSPRHRLERFEIVHEFFADHLGGGSFDTA